MSLLRIPYGHGATLHQLERHNLSCHFHLYQQHSSFVLPKRPGTARSRPGPCGCIPLASSLRLARLRRVRERGTERANERNMACSSHYFFFQLQSSGTSKFPKSNILVKVSDDDDMKKNSLAHNPPLVRYLTLLAVASRGRKTPLRGKQGPERNWGRETLRPVQCQGRPGTIAESNTSRGSLHVIAQAL
jgi:hypothetical protein